MINEGQLLGSHIFDFHNLGYILRQVSTVTTYNAMAKLSFVIDIPRRSHVNSTMINCETRSGDQVMCERLEGILLQIRRVHVDSARQLQQALDSIAEIVDTLNNNTRSRRSLFDFIPRALSYVTGLAKQSDVDTLKHAMSKIDSVVERSMEVVKISSTHFSQVMHIQSDRIDALERLAELGRTSVEVLYQKLSGDWSITERMASMLTNAFSALSQRIRHLSHVDQFTTSLEFLLGGKIPVELVPIKSLKRMLDHLDRHLYRHHPHLTLIHRDPQFYYREGTFFLVKRNRTLIIQIECPLSSVAQPFQLFNLEKVPLIIPGSHGHYSMLSDTYAGIAFNENYLFTIAEGRDVWSFPREIDLTESDVHLIERLPKRFNTG